MEDEDTPDYTTAVQKEQLTPGDDALSGPHA